MDKKEEEAPSLRQKVANLLAPQTLKWIIAFSFFGGGLSFACAFIAVSAGIVANIPTEPVIVEPTFSMSSALNIALVGVIGTVISAVVFIGASVFLAVQLLNK